MSRALRWVLVVAVVAVAAVTVGPFVYINFIRDDPPPRLSLDGDASTSATPTGATDPASLDGAWEVGAGSQAGYRAREILFGQDAEAVGRTSDVTGSVEIDGTAVAQASFTVDMTTVTSDQSRRDGQFHGRIMDTATFPTASFELTEPIDLASVPAAGEQVTVTAVGELTLRGVTNSVTVHLDARHDGTTIEVVGSIPVHFDDYEIPDTSGGPASVGREGEVEFLLVLTR